MKNFAERFVLILVPLLLAACVPTVDTACDSVDGLTAALRDSGAEADSGEQIDQSFFTVPAQRLVVNAEDVQVFAYPSVDLARSDAAQVSPDGYSVGTSMVTWIATPHFFQCGKLIVLYVGDNSELLTMLKAQLGSQFAGG